MNGGATSPICPDAVLDRFASDVGLKLLKANGLMLVNAVLTGILVIVEVCRPHARRNPLIGVLLLGASALFLPIVSEVVSTVGAVAGGSDEYTSYLYNGRGVLAAQCRGPHIALVLVWTAIVITIGVNTSRVAVMDAREGTSVKPSIEMWIKAVWLTYLIVVYGSAFFSSVSYIRTVLENENATLLLMFNVFFITFLPLWKLLGKLQIYYKAKRSVTIGRRPQLIVGYMASRNNTAQINGEQHTPELVVWVSDGYCKLVEQPSSFSLEDVQVNLLVTLKRVWEQPDDMLFNQKHKDLCFSFALFQLLRCRFAKYTVAQAGIMEAQFFFRQEYLSVKDQHDRVFQVIADELSFINYYYSSSLPFTPPSLSSFVNLTIGYCLYTLVLLSIFVSQAPKKHLEFYQQVSCSTWCPGQTTQPIADNGAIGTEIFLGNIFFDVVPIYIVLVVLLFSEIKDIVYSFSANWIRVDLICWYLQPTCSPNMKKWIRSVVSGCRWKLVNKLVNSWGDEMNQCSILVRRPWWKPSWLFGFRNKSIKQLDAVKESIYTVLRTQVQQEGAVKHIRRPSFPVTVEDTDGNGRGASSFSACGCRSVADSILAWHIATSLFELKKQENPDLGCKIAATQLSCYCTYLVACRPELLPDQKGWCRKLYADVLDQADRVLRAAGGGAGFQRLVDEFLRAEPERDDDASKVLRNGATLAEKLVKDSNKGWKELAHFWSEMVLYIAPSENLEGHAEAIARGGELVTLLWALLAHAGIVDRPDDEPSDHHAPAGNALNTPAQAEAATNTAAGDHHV